MSKEMKRNSFPPSNSLPSRAVMKFVNEVSAAKTEAARQSAAMKERVAFQAFSSLSYQLNFRMIDVTTNMATMAPHHDHWRSTR